MLRTQAHNATSGHLNSTGVNPVGELGLRIFIFMFFDSPSQPDCGVSESTTKSSRGRESKLRSAVDRFEKAYPLSYGLSYESKTAIAGMAEVINSNDESGGIRTQDLHIKRAGDEQ